MGIEQYLANLAGRGFDSSHAVSKGRQKIKKIYKKFIDRKPKSTGRRRSRRLVISEPMQIDPQERQVHQRRNSLTKQILVPTQKKQRPSLPKTPLPLRRYSASSPSSRALPKLPAFIDIYRPEGLKPIIKEYIKVPTSEGYRDALPVLSDNNGLFRALSLAIDYTEGNHQQYRELIANAVSQDSQFYYGFLPKDNRRHSLRTFSKNYAAELQATGREVRKGNPRDLWIFAIKTRIQIRVCVFREKEWKWEEQPTQRFQETFKWKPKGTIELHYTAANDGGIWSVIESNPPRFEKGCRKSCKFNTHFKLENMMIVSVEPDGNSLFRAVSLRIEGSEAYHMHYRVLTFSTIRKNPGFFTGNSMTAEHLKKTEDVNNDGTEVEIWALSRATRLNISVFVDAEYTWIDYPKVPNAKGHIRLLQSGAGFLRHYALIMDNSEKVRIRNDPMIWHYLSNIPSLPKPKPKRKAGLYREKLCE